MSTQTEAPRTQAPAPARPADIRHSWLAAGLVLLGIGAALVAVLGPLVSAVIEYHVSEGAPVLRRTPGSTSNAA
jgi:hypothetical protein